MQPKRPCRHTRNVCPLCYQDLGYTALHCHRDLPHIYCPGYTKDIDDSSDSESSESTISPSELSPTGSSVICGQNTPRSNLSSSSASQASSSSESDPEVWDQTSDSSSSDESDSDFNCAVDDVENLRFIVCLFLAFFNFVIAFLTGLFHISFPSFLHY